MVMRWTNIRTIPMMIMNKAITIGAPMPRNGEEYPEWGLE